MGTYKNHDFWLTWVIGDGATRAIHQCGRGRPGSLVQFGVDKYNLK